MLDEAAIVQARENATLSGTLGLLQTTLAAFLDKDAAEEAQKRLTALVIEVAPRGGSDGE